MIPENRKKQILAILKQHGYCSVEQLAQSVYVSLPTMRRDLTQLEQEGLIKRLHGGASYFKGDMPMMPFALRNQAMIKEKMRIGELPMQSHPMALSKNALNSEYSLSLLNIILNLCFIECDYFISS